MEKFLVKFAWKCNHEKYGEIISFLVTPYQETSPFSYGYRMDKSDEEVIRFPSHSIEATQLLRRLAPMGNNQWSMPSYGDFIEQEFDLDDFFEEYIYQDNYGKEVLFHTHGDCLS